MNPSTLRILDANANRAREALRVIEDHARFALNHDGLCGALKQIRHDLATTYAPFVHDAILHRDTPGDVGTSVKVTGEMTRDNESAIVIAAGKRLGEALRTIEEYLKIENASAAGAVESIRYRFYDVEKQVAQTLRPVACSFADVRLYVLITESFCKRDWFETARLALEGGADCIQLREKSLDGGELLRRANQLVELCRSHKAICIINDRPDIAVLSNADGVHVGQGDLPATEARKIVGRQKIVGVSTHTLEQAQQALIDGADYIGIGPVFPSTTKPRDILPGLDFARAVAEKVPLPSIAIAGITLENVSQVLATGVSGIAVSSAVAGADDPRAAASAFQKQLKSRPHPQLGAASPS